MKVQKGQPIRASMFNNLIEKVEGLSRMPQQIDPLQIPSTDSNLALFRFSHDGNGNFCYARMVANASIILPVAYPFEIRKTTWDANLVGFYETRWITPAGFPFRSSGGSQNDTTPERQEVYPRYSRNKQFWAIRSQEGIEGEEFNGAEWQEVGQRGWLAV